MPMLRKVAWFLLILVCLLSHLVLSLAVAQTKGLSRVRLADGSGEELELYRQSYALIIGVSDYTAGWPDLESVPGELEKLEKALVEQRFVVTKHLNPNAQQLKLAFDQFIHSYGYNPHNRLLFFFSGHGHTRNEGRRGYLVPSDAPVPRQDEIGFLRKSLGMNRILSWAREMEVRHALFLFDSCFSGTVFKVKALPNEPPHITRLTAEPVRQFITAGSAGEVVPANSVFTPAFIDALSFGVGDLDKDGYVTGTELGLYLQSTVPKYAQQKPQFGKIRDYELARGDYVFRISSRTQTLQPSPPIPPPITPAPSLGHIHIMVNVEDAKVYLNGRYTGKAHTGKPLSKRNLATGSMEVRVEAGGHKVDTRIVEILPNQWSRVQFELNPLEALAYLTVRSNVSDDMVFIDGIAKGPTGPDAHSIAPGQHKLRVEKTGLCPYGKECHAGEWRTQNNTSASVSKIEYWCHRTHDDSDRRRMFPNGQPCE